MTSPVASFRFRPRLLPTLVVLVPLGCFAWAFWTTFIDLAQTWKTNPQYSHGYLVPGFALLLLWLRRDKLDAAALRPSWWGIPLLLAGIGLRLWGAYYYYIWLDPASLLPCLCGLTLMLGGRAAWRWAWPALLFLAFMIPLPYRFASALSGPLQRLATLTSTFVMQTVGLPALAEGNLILLNDDAINIVEACSGLRMLVVFFALAAAVTLVIRRPWLDKALIIASAVPIALISNIARVTATGILHEAVNSETAHAFFHDVAGWFMMPLALGLLWVELKVLSHLFIDPPHGTLRAQREAAVRRAARAPAAKAPARTPAKAPAPKAPAAAPQVKRAPRSSRATPPGTRPQPRPQAPAAPPSEEHVDSTGHKT